MTSPIETVREFMASFIGAWPTADATRLAPFFSDDATYHNMPVEAVHGRKAIVATLAGFMSLGGAVEVELVHIVADGPVVLTERVDRFVIGGQTISLSVMGTFEVHDGGITAWRDYFDLQQFTKQLPAGP